MCTRRMLSSAFSFLFVSFSPFHLLSVAVFQPNYLPPMAEQMSQPYVGMAGSYDGNVEVSNEQENYERQLRRMDETNEPMRDRHRDRDRDSDRDRDYSRRRKSGDRLVTNIIC